MAFNHKTYINKYVNTPSNDAVNYGVSIDHAQAQEGELYFRAIGVHHLLPSENSGNRNVYIDVLDENNQRIRGALVNWTWVGRNEGTEPARPVMIDKPDNEPGANISIGSKQIISIWVAGARSDRVINLKSVHPDEPGGNQLGHHSFYVVFKRVQKGVVIPPPPNGGTTDPPPPDPENPVEGFTQFIPIFENDKIRVRLIIEVK